MALICVAAQAQTAPDERLTVAFDGPQYECLTPSQRVFLARGADSVVRVTASAGWLTIPQGPHGIDGQAFQAAYYCSGFNDHTLVFTFSEPVSDLRFAATSSETFIINGRFYNFDSSEIVIPGPIGSLVFSGQGSHSPSNGWGITVRRMSFKKTESVPTFAFALPAAQNERVLIHKYGPDAYTSALQTSDGQIAVEGNVRDSAGNPIAGKTVYFRLLDPPDPAPYVVHAGDSKADDNVDGPGTLNGGSTTGSGVSGADGKGSAILGVTDHVAGDNYQLEASLDPTFKCTGACPRSATYTAWKRVYVEVNKMFRSGAFLTADAPAGAKEIKVDNIRPLPRPPFRARLLHAPMVDQTGDFLTSEIVTVMNVTSTNSFLANPRPGTLHLDPAPNVSGLQHAYVGPEKVKRDDRQYLADAIGVITGDREKDFFLPDCALVNSTFAGAFTEHVWMTDSSAADPDLPASVPRIPFDGVVPFRAVLNENDEWERAWTALKWIRSAKKLGLTVREAIPNHQVLFTASGKLLQPGQTAYGDTLAASGYNDTWFYIGSVPRLATFSRTVDIRESIAHELTHQWRVNPPTATTGGHCGSIALALGGKTMYDDGSRACPMSRDLYASGDPQEGDGLFKFHYEKDNNGKVDSEYLRIRQREEPVPQSDPPDRPEPQ